jgi:hypothetical protein
MKKNEPFDPVNQPVTDAAVPFANVVTRDGVSKPFRFFKFYPGRAVKAYVGLTHQYAFNNNIHLIIVRVFRILNSWK